MFDEKKVKSELVNWIKKTVGDSNVVIGISGGKDSSITAALCVEALGKDRVSWFNIIYRELKKCRL